VDNTLKQIDARLRELTAEVSRLEAARAALMNGAASRTPARRRRRGRRRQAAATTPTASAARRRPGRPSKAAPTAAALAAAPRRRGRTGGQRTGTRANQALELVRKRPGVTIPQLAKAMKIEPNYLYRVMPSLVSAGQVRREGNCWHAAT
jgi:hypothetical protein